MLLVEVNAPRSAEFHHQTGSPSISSLSETVWTSSRERYWKTTGEKRGTERWAEDLERTWGCSYEQKAFGVCSGDSVGGNEKWNAFNNGWSRDCHSSRLFFFFLRTQAVFQTMTASPRCHNETRRIWQWCLSNISNIPAVHWAVL